MSNLLNKNYFQIFDLKEEFCIDQNKLKTQYYRLIEEYHPDNKETDRSYNIQSTILINDAFEMLKDDYKRITYLLDINNIKTHEDKLKQYTDFNLLTETLEYNELIDNISSLQEILLEYNKLNKKKDDLLEQINIIWNKYNGKNIDNQINLLEKEILPQIVKLKYTNNIIKITKEKIKNLRCK